MNRIERPVQRRTRKWTSAVLVAAICVVTLAATALAVGLLHLDERRGDTVAPVEPQGDIVYTDVNAIGSMDSPEYKAAQEWHEWCLAHIEDNTLFPDGIENYSSEEIDATTDTVGNNVYVRLGANTDEARAALDSIAAKYGLRVPESFREVTPKDLYDMTGVTDILPWDVDLGTGIWYEGGYLSVINQAVLENGKTINYDLIRSVRGMFSEAVQVVLEQDITEEWQYTTADGTTVTLDLGQNRSVLMAELPNSFVYVNIRGGTENNDETRDFTGSDTLTREDLEAFAEHIDFKTLDIIQ